MDTWDLLALAPPLYARSACMGAVGYILDGPHTRCQGIIAPGLPLTQAVDLLNAVMHGQTALHVANVPDHPAGTGRFGALIPAAITLFEQAWNLALAVSARPSAPGDDASAPRGEGGKEG